MDDSLFKDKVLLVQAQSNGQILHDEELQFLADPRIPKGQATQSIALMANLLQFGSDALAKSFYNHSTKKALDFQNPIYLKKARKLEPKLYNGDVIQTNCAIVIPDSEETLLFTKKSHFKMLLKQKDTMVSEKKFNTKPIDYAALNQLLKDFATRFVPQSELSTEQVFCPSSDPIPSNRPTIVEVPSELPKVSMVDTSLQKLKRHLAGFDVSREKGTVIKKLKERVKSLSENMDNDKVKRDIDETETINIELEHRVSKLVAKNEHLKQTYKQLYDSTKLARIQSKEQCDALINQVNIKSVKISDLNVSFQEQALVITALKEELRNLKGKAVVENAITSPTIALKMYEIDVQPIAFRLLHNRMVHSEYLRFFGPLRNKLRLLGR
nr:pyruvate, phosphate dikinase regulatory protein, chloroplastic [Tanacetum cinerariifolium]